MEMKCVDMCHYDHIANDFSCTCPANFKLADDARGCVLDSGFAQFKTFHPKETLLTNGILHYILRPKRRFFEANYMYFLDLRVNY